MSDSNIEVKTSVVNPRLAYYKCRTIPCDQECRRFELLADQKRKRAKAFDDARNPAFMSALESDDDNESSNNELEPMDWNLLKPKKLRLKDMFMLSEWMIDVPHDFYSNWLFVACPVGKRCLVRCSKGSTSVYGKRGQKLAKFQSALPNGSVWDANKCKYSNAEITLLDCIWNSQTQSYYILDLLAWKGQTYMDTERSFRAFWIKSKAEENPGLSIKSESNCYPFVPIESHSCERSSIEYILSNTPHYLSGSIKIDGLLFYHKEASYSPGSTPLVLWLKPFMIPELLDLDLPEVFEYFKPNGYINMHHYIREYEEKKVRRKRRHKTGEKDVDITLTSVNELMCNVSPLYLSNLKMKKKKMLNLPLMNNYRNLK